MLRLLMLERLEAEPLAPELLQKKQARKEAGALPQLLLLLLFSKFRIMGEVQGV